MKKILFAIVAMFLCVSAFSQAEKAKYYIEGDYSITQSTNGQFIYQLSNISSKGIHFTPVEYIYGTKEADESISFTFDKASTDCPEGFSSGLKFWKWQYNGKEYTWQRDSEVKDAQQEFETDKVMVVMLVLDCSKSLGDDNFAKLKNSATKFINILYNASSDGSIRLGIIGFNTMGNADRMTRQIEPLTASSRDEMIRFIQDMTLYNNTALYYAMHKGSDMISNYVENLSSVESEKFDYACMVSFTDGYDNHSMDANIGVPQEGLDNPYYQYVRDHVVNRTIANSNLKSYVIAIKGNDVSEDNKLYKAVFDGLSSEDPILLSDFSELENQFENMAQELIKRWQNLTCYVPSAHQGKVRWTIGDYTEKVVREEPKEEKVEAKTVEAPMYPGLLRKNFIGVDGCLDMEFTSTFYIGLGLGFDFAVPFPRNDKVAMGGFATLKYCIAGPTHVGAGPMLLIGDYENKSAFMLGLGLDFRCPTETYNRPRKIARREFGWTKENWEHDNFGLGATLRLGATKGRFFAFMDFSAGAYNSWYLVPLVQTDGTTIMGTHDEKHPYVNVSLNLGYRFKNRK